MSDHNCSRFSGLAAVEGRRRLSGWRFEPGLAAVAAKSLSSVGFTHPQGSYCEQSRPIAGLNQQCKTPGDGERRGALMTQGHLRRRGDSSRKAQERTSSRSSSSVQSGKTLFVRISKRLEMLFGQTDEVVRVDWGDEDWVSCVDSSSFASPVPGVSFQPPDIFFPL